MLKRYLQSGWKLDRVTGSHHIVVKGSVSVSIPVHSGKALKRGTEQKLLKLGGFT
ncbi:MAG: hypothetical protein Pg6C_11920 [Treponemataceae bacterium]|nr:MAG: hypothetical protein Pg6C_11920 [Treponemataceae bacterium]